MSRRLIALVALALGLSIQALPAAAREMVSVEADQALILRLPVPATTIIVGNPAVADAAVFDINTLIVTGKSFGATNLLVMDETGTIAAEYELVVSSASAGRVVMHRGNQRYSLSCAPDCEPSLVPGDNLESYQNLFAQTQQRIDMSLGQSLED